MLRTNIRNRTKCGPNGVREKRFMKIFDTRAKDVVLYSMKMFNESSPYHDIIKRKCKFLHNIMSSTNLLCQICKDFADKELRGYSCPDCAQ